MTIDQTPDDGSAGRRRLIEAGATVGPGVRAWLGSNVLIGRDVTIGARAVLAADTLTLGDGVTIGEDCDLRAGTLFLGDATELQASVTVLVADAFEVEGGGRIESGTHVTCRSFQADRLLYLGQGTSVGYGGTTASTSHVVLGARVAIGPHSILNANHPIILGDQVGSGSHLTIWTHGFHFGHRLLDGYPATFAPVRIERNVWLAYHATVLPGVTIGADTIIAAGSVVSRDLPAGVLAGGVPAAVKRTLEPRPPRTRRPTGAWTPCSTNGSPSSSGRASAPSAPPAAASTSRAATACCWSPRTPASTPSTPTPTRPTGADSTCSPWTTAPTCVPGPAAAAPCSNCAPGGSPAVSTRSATTCATSCGATPCPAATNCPSAACPSRDSPGWPRSPPSPPPPGTADDQHPRQAPHTTTPHTTTPQHTALPGPAGGPRNLDLRYADRPVDSEHPHYFPFVVDHAEPWLRDHPDGPVCEVGCAAGAFAHYLLGRHPGTDLTCVDLQPTLIEQARLRVPGARFLTGDVLRPDTLPAGPFTTVFMVALHSHFDDPQQWIDALLRLTAPGGRAYVFGLFNPEPVDVVIRLRHSDSDPEWLPGWNQFSVQTVGRLLDAAGLGHAFHRYLPTAPRARQSQDPLRSHTVPDPDAHPEAGADPALVYLNGSQMLHRFALLEIHRPEAEAAAAGDRS